MPFIIVTVIVVLDQLSKHFISTALRLHESVPIINGIFHLTLVHNRGAAFGLLKNQVYLFILTAFTAILLIFFHLRKHTGVSVYTVGLSLILAGAVGNLVDRLRFGYVLDFLDFRVWPVFNIADSAITVGACLAVWATLKNKQ
jgi:signal peptidase II